jgi:hypothetical protein
VEGETLWSGCCCESSENVLEQRLTEDTWRGLQVVLFPCVDALTRPCTEILQGGRDVEKSSAPKCAAADGSDDDRDSVRDDIGVDGAWEYQRLRESTSGCRPARACGLSIQILAVFASLTIA